MLRCPALLMLPLLMLPCLKGPAAVWRYAALCLALQAGEAIAIKPEDRKPLVMGLALHDMAKARLAKVRRGVCVCV